MARATALRSAYTADQHPTTKARCRIDSAACGYQIHAGSVSKEIQDGLRWDMRSSKQAPWSICIGNAEDEWTPANLMLEQSEVQEMSNKSTPSCWGSSHWERIRIQGWYEPHHVPESGESAFGVLSVVGLHAEEPLRQEMERILQIRMNGPPPSRQGDVGHAPWLYELESDIQAGERLVFVQHRIPPPKANEKEEARLNLQFLGQSDTSRRAVR